MILSALTQILELVRGRQRTAGCFGEQRKGGEEGRADSSFLRANFVAECTVVTGKQTREKVLKYRTSKSDTTPPVSVWQMSLYAFGSQPSQGLS